jgi:hypothetical protein
MDFTRKIHQIHQNLGAFELFAQRISLYSGEYKAL